MLLNALLLTACGGGGTPAATPSLVFVSVKTFRFVWTDVDGATHYKLLEDPNGSSGFSQVGSDIAQGNQTVDHIVPLYARINAKYILQSCNDAGCADSESLSVGAELGASIGYFKAIRSAHRWVAHVARVVHGRFSSRTEGHAPYQTR